MAELSFWHPVLLEKQLGDKPEPIRVLDQDLVLFRGDQGIGCLPDRCPHRGERLSRGFVRDGDLACPYHGWTWSPAGKGHCPGDGSFSPTIPHFDVAVAHGAIWIREPGGRGELPSFETTGFRPLTVFSTRLPGSLERVLDNFSESEHTPEVHLMGFDSRKMDQVRVTVQTDKDSVHVVNRGPQRRTMKLLRLGVGVPLEADYVIEWTTRFQPVHAQFDHYWLPPGKEEPYDKRVRAWVYFVPVSPTETQLFSFVFVNEGPLWERLGDALHARYARWDIEQDRPLLEGLAPELGEAPTQGWKSRFDEGLEANRERLQKLYRGSS
jgi:phenylpropionate dioxygenase-like ring-hydroxylating dioxygenase large terminal subunit